MEARRCSGVSRAAFGRGPQGTPGGCGGSKLHGGQRDRGWCSGQSGGDSRRYKGGDCIRRDFKRGTATSSQRRRPEVPPSSMSTRLRWPRDQRDSDPWEEVEACVRHVQGRSLDQQSRGGPKSPRRRGRAEESESGGRGYGTRKGSRRGEDGKRVFKQQFHEEGQEKERRKEEEEEEGQEEEKGQRRVRRKRKERVEKAGDEEPHGKDSYVIGSQGPSLASQRDWTGCPGTSSSTCSEGGPKIPAEEVFSYVRDQQLLELGRFNQQGYGGRVPEHHLHREHQGEEVGRALSRRVGHGRSYSNEGESFAGRGLPGGAEPLETHSALVFSERSSEEGVRSTGPRAADPLHCRRHADEWSHSGSFRSPDAAGQKHREYPARSTLLGVSAAGGVTTGGDDTDWPGGDEGSSKGVLCRQQVEVALIHAGQERGPAREQGLKGQGREGWQECEIEGKRRWWKERGCRQEGEVEAVPQGTGGLDAVEAAPFQAGGLEHWHGKVPEGTESAAFSPTTTAAAGEKVESYYQPAAALVGSFAGPSQPSEEKSELQGHGGFEGMDLGTVGTLVLQRLLEVCVSCSLRGQTTGNGRNRVLFPLPTSRSLLSALFPDLSDGEISWLIAMCLGLNSIWGEELCSEKPVSTSQRDCLGLLVKDIERFCCLKGTLDSFDWKNFFDTRSIDYKGDEVRTARYFSWENIGPALPREIGMVSLEDVCTEGCRHYVLHFPNYLKPRDRWVVDRPPKVMVADADWGRVCSELVRCGLCTYLEREEVFDTGSGPLLNGMFGVSKEEWSQGTEIYRLIMNLIPLNNLCLPLSGDVDTLPSWSLMSPFFLQPSESLLVSSEDVRCFFYTLAVPQEWWPFLAFNKVVPDEALPLELRGHEIYLASKVLPMGFLNSVSIAQHVHRNLVLWSGLDEDGSANQACDELRKDKSFPQTRKPWRVYLDNYDLLEKVESTDMVSTRGSVAPGVLALRQEYEVWGVPRNEKKSVQRSNLCEMQGAQVDGVLGVAYPRESKLLKYLAAALKLCQSSSVSQKQAQVVCGGLVYFSMFRRPLLGCLNSVWQFIEDFNNGGPFTRPLPQNCRLEITRFVALLPLARIDFRLPMEGQVSCSDASSSGGGFCASVGVTKAGSLVSQGLLRGEIQEGQGDHRVLSVGLFDGIGALRVALDLCGANVLGHISVEKNPIAARVVEAHFPGSLIISDVCDVTEDMVKEWSLTYSQASVVLLGGGPPCQGVSGLNADRKGALKDLRSCLFVHVPRIKALLQRAFPWAQVHALMESVASMDKDDRDIMSNSVDLEPMLIDAGKMTWCSRPRFYWLSWSLSEGSGVHFATSSAGVTEVVLEACQDLEDVCKEGWIKVDPSKSFPTFTTSRPRDRAGHRPAGIRSCSSEDLDRWMADSYRFPPYQYCSHHCLVSRSGELRIPDVEEREYMLGFPVGYTWACMSKAQVKTVAGRDARLTLLGNTWSVPVVAWLVSQLLGPLGISAHLSPQEVMDRLDPQNQEFIQGRLFRSSLRPRRGTAVGDESALAFKLGNLISVKGEDIMLNAPSAVVPRFQRLRGTVPSRLWRWRVISGWRWTGGSEHINALEMRAILTSMRWRLEHQGLRRVRFLHLTDSMVCLHALTRGRTSSRKLRRTVSRINALVLLTGVHPIWGYVHTDQNPADKPSRWASRVKTKYRNAKTPFRR